MNSIHTGLLTKIAEDIMRVAENEQINMDDFQDIIKKIIRGGYEENLPDIATLDLAIALLQRLFINIHSQIMTAEDQQTH